MSETEKPYVEELRRAVRAFIAEHPKLTHKELREQLRKLVDETTKEEVGETWRA